LCTRLADGGGYSDRETERRRERERERENRRDNRTNVTTLQAPVFPVDANIFKLRDSTYVGTCHTYIAEIHRSFTTKLTVAHYTGIHRYKEAKPNRKMTRNKRTIILLLIIFILPIPSLAVGLRLVTAEIAITAYRKQPYNTDKELTGLKQYPRSSELSL